MVLFVEDGATTTDTYTTGIVVRVPAVDVCDV